MDRLPAEILQQIAQEITNQACDPCGDCYQPTEKCHCFHIISTLNAWSKSSRSLYAASITELYRSVHLNTEQLRSFLTTIIENRKLASYVKQVRFSFKDYVPKRYEPWYVYDEQTRSRTGEVRYSVRYHDTQPLSGEIELSDNLRTKFRTAAAQSGFDWDAETLAAMDSGSTNAEAILLLQVLPGIALLDLDFPINDEDDDDDLLREEKQGLFRHDVFRAFLNQKDKYPQSQLDDGRHQPLATLKRVHLPRPFEEPFSIKAEWPRNVFWELHELSGIFWLHGLRSISIDRCVSGTGRSIRSDMPNGIRELIGTSNLEEISITSAMLEPKALNLMLRLPRALKSFKYEIAETEHVFRYREESQDDQLGKLQYISPEQLFAGLHHHHKSLQHLDLFTFGRDPYLKLSWGDEYRDHLGLRDSNEPWRQEQSRLVGAIDLHQFEALKHVSASAIDLLGPEILYDFKAYSRFVEVLPPALEVLVLYNACRSGESGNEAHYGHIEDLLHSKNQRFRDLRRIEMVVGPTWPLAGEDLHRLAASVDVSLSVKYEKDKMIDEQE